ncbi:type II secretion system protein N [Alloalcanivorax sp. C16-2]|uniref:type II secretion system protein N n=1 Tax=Alloalcanivorax sp. C16-2 TaxID=3390052 RepID=UPI003970AAE4
MKGQKIITKCLFLAALFFLSLIFFFANERNGTDDAGQKTERPSPALTPRAERAARVAPPPAVETPAALLSKEQVPGEPVDVGSLALLAVFQAHSPLASAVIHVEGHGAHRYHVGAELPEGGVLAAIRSTEVVIEDAGRRITLRMALLGGGGRAEVADVDEEVEDASDNDRPKMPQRVLDFLSKLDLTPVSEDSPDGYLVGDDFPESGREEIGVKPGDTIVAVNGYPVGEYNSDYLVWLSFKDRYRASVLVRSEDGKEFSFHFPDDLQNVSLPGPGG